MTGTIQSKVRRNGHMFWVRDCRELEPGVFVGTVNNDGVPFHPLDSLIAFVSSEVVDVSTDGLSMFDHRADKPN